MSDIKTLIELFDEIQIENVVSGLRFKPEKIVFIGFKATMKENRKEDLKALFKKLSPKTEIEFHYVGRFDYEPIYECLELVLDKNEDCCFDVTGGKEVVLAVMGEIAAERNVPMLQINVKTGEIIRLKNCESLPETKKTALTIEDSILLNGCIVDKGEAGSFQWSITEDFKKDIEAAWEISRKNPGLYNKQSSAFDSFEKYGTYEDLTIYANFSRIKRDSFVSGDIVNVLEEKGLIKDLVVTAYDIRFRYKNEQVHRLLSKAGNVLELYAYVLMQEIQKEDEGFYDDVGIGVFVDWDGVIHAESENQKDTVNEIDLLLTRDVIPIFISCKNGEVHKEALYELSVVAKKFGGAYARTCMLSTYVNSNTEAKKYIKQRANDMGIDLIDDLHLLSREEFKEELKKRIK